MSCLYERVYEHLGPRVMKPDLVIYLQARLDVLLGRIRKRWARVRAEVRPRIPGGAGATYNDFFHRYDETPLLVINPATSISWRCERTSRADPGNRVDQGGDHYYQPLGTRV